METVKGTADYEKDTLSFGAHGKTTFAVLLLLIIFFVDSILPSHGYDPMDPNGHVTIKWDLLQSNTDTGDSSETRVHLSFWGKKDTMEIYEKDVRALLPLGQKRKWLGACLLAGHLHQCQIHHINTFESPSVKVSIFNYQLYRHVEPPGWKLSWDWTGREVIWGMWGAEATEQGNCSAYRGKQLPHCCEKNPVIVDLLPGAPYNVQSQNCCKGGVLSSLTQDPSKYGATFHMNVGGFGDGSDFVMPENITLGLPGYTCNNATAVKPSRYTTDGGRRWTQALRTWNVTCVYSQFVASATPKCCVSLSAFYDSTVVHCPKCSCSCQGQAGAKCAKFGDAPPLLQQKLNLNIEEPPAIVRCTEHMCPIRVHWHLKESYKEYWRVKITVANLNIVKNYSQWTLVVQHPNLRSLIQVFSFNYEPLNQYGYINDTGMFWGIQYYNDLLLQEGESGNVQTEILLRKDPDMFTFSEGWAFPRKISFNGDECVMPPPDIHPRLPNNGQLVSYSSSSIVALMLFTLVF